MKKVNKCIEELIEIGNKAGSTKVSALTREEIKENIKILFEKSKKIVDINRAQ